MGSRGIGMRTISAVVVAMQVQYDKTAVTALQVVEEIDDTVSADKVRSQS